MTETERRTGLVLAAMGICPDDRIIPSVESYRLAEAAICCAYPSEPIGDAFSVWRRCHCCGRVWVFDAD